MLGDMDDQRIAKWARWCETTIKDNVLTMHLHRNTWVEVSKIIENNGQLPDSYWWQFMWETYAVTQAVAVRREADIHKDVASLGKLIQEIREDPSRITRDFWIGLWDDDDEPTLMHAQRAWAKQYGGGTDIHLDPAIPSADSDTLAAAASRVKTYVDKHVAHADASPASAAITISLTDVHDAIDVVGHLFKRYYNLLTAASYASLVPVIQHNWTAVFREPWLRVPVANPSR